MNDRFCNPGPGRHWPSLLPLLLAGVAIPGNAAPTQTAPRPAGRGNGIVVGQPKLFSADMLNSMLQQAVAQLAALNAYNADKLNAAQGTVQGGQANINALNLSALGSPVPGVVTTNSETGGDKPTTGVSAVTTRPAVTPAAPTVASPARVYSGAQPMSIAAQDILAEQTALTYQIINLRMLLDRALTDRVSVDRGIDDSKDAVRQQAVIGFQVSIAPAPEDRDAVAVVDISISNDVDATVDLQKKIGKGDFNSPQISLLTLSTSERTNILKMSKEIMPSLSTESAISMFTSNDVTGDSLKNKVTSKLTTEIAKLPAPSLVSLMPQEKTYNVASITQNSKSAGLGAIVGAFSLGLSGSKSNETFYLIKDIDTVALQKPSNKDALNFGWNFYPVLGQRTVLPGQRQVFASVALPTGPDESYVADIHIKTRWYKWDRNRRALTQPIGACTWDSIYELKVVNDTLTEAMLAPRVEELDWEQAGPGLLRVNLWGQNFLPETALHIGDKTIDRASGLTGSGENHLLFMPTAAQVMSGKDPLLVTRFGTGELRAKKSYQRELDAIKKGTGDREKATWGLGIASATWLPTTADHAKVTIELMTRDGEADLKQSDLLAQIGDQIFGLSDNPFDPIASDDKAATKTITFTAPLSLINSSPRVTVRRPFWGKAYAATAGLNLPDKPLHVAGVTKVVTLLADGVNKAGDVLLAITGDGFTKDTKVSLADSSTNLATMQWITDGLLTVTVPPADLLRTTQLKMTDGTKSVGPKTVFFKLAPPPRKATFEPVSVQVGDTEQKITGANLDTVHAISYFGDSLPLIDNGDGSLTLHIPEAATKTPGNKGFEVILEDGSRLNLVITVKQVPEAKQPVPEVK